jgi:hypothetical protein
MILILIMIIQVWSLFASETMSRRDRSKMTPYGCFVGRFWSLEIQDQTESFGWQLQVVFVSFLYPKNQLKAVEHARRNSSLFCHHKLCFFLLLLT